MYRPPNTDVSLFNLELSGILDMINNDVPKLAFITGDHKLDLLKYETHAPTGDFLSSLFSHSYLPTIRYPTRITETSATLIDNICINSIKQKFETAIIYSDISDHLPVAMGFDLNISKNKPLPKYVILARFK